MRIISVDVLLFLSQTTCYTGQFWLFTTWVCSFVVFKNTILIKVDSGIWEHDLIFLFGYFENYFWTNSVLF